MGGVPSKQQLFRSKGRGRIPDAASSTPERTVRQNERRMGQVMMFIVLFYLYHVGFVFVILRRPSSAEKIIDILGLLFMHRCTKVGSCDMHLLTREEGKPVAMCFFVVLI